MRLLSALLLLTGCLVATPAASQFTATRVASGLAEPLLATAPTDDPSDERLFIVGKGGQVRILRDGAVLGTPFLDITGLVSDGGEEGLLGLAFAPDYAASGLFYINYTNNSGDTVVARYSVSGNPDVANAGSAEILFTIDQPAGNHNGGHLAFSPVDGFLYIGMGDGGEDSDTAQDFSNPLGAMLRIDVSDAPGFEIPASNPGFGDARIWANGLRNPFRFSFDRLTGDLFIGDVGAQAREEVNFQPASSGGGENYVWPECEGTACGQPGWAVVGPAVFPVIEYAHGEFPNVQSVIGGYRYRGPEISLRGIYFFGDLGGLLFAATETGPGEFDFERITVTPDQGSIDVIVSFGEDTEGNVYIVDLDGEVFRIDGSLECPEVPRDDCLLAGTSKLTLKESGSGGKLKWKWAKGEAIATADFGDPISTATHLLCVYSGTPAALSMEAVVPPGSSWKATGEKGFKYKDKDGSPDGIGKVKLKSGEAGQAKLSVAGKGSNLDLPDLPVDESGPVIVQLNNDASGACWEDAYAGEDVSRNDADRFKAKTR